MNECGHSTSRRHLAVPPRRPHIGTDATGTDATGAPPVRLRPAPQPTASALGTLRA
ncbi:hypothetical protein ACFVYP_35320 [Kitasatospora sp. NPDC058201]|uniref:hypothetical protein n=1 Tax=unclassified Kitasatospora TaxID=2633591 RepID=UPI00365230E6